MTTMNLSVFGLGLIKRFEGCRLSTYLDGYGHPTIGYGHLLGPTENTTGLKWTAGRAETQLLADTRLAVAGVNRFVGVTMSQPQFDALVSLTFNVGVHAFGSSTLLTNLNAEDYTKAADEFLVWNSHGLLLRRRTEERSIFLYGTT